MSMTNQISAIRAALSRARFATYEKASSNKVTQNAALNFYEWNARISAAFLFPQQVCEVTTRNAAAGVLEQVFGPHWPWCTSFERNLPNPQRAYSMRSDLLNARAKGGSPQTGKVVAELAFKFWVNIFSARFDQRLWNSYILSAFPYLPVGFTATQARLHIHTELDQVRRLRNRIAHHEPIFARNLQDDYARLRNLIAWRCLITAAWVDSQETVAATLPAKP